MNRAIGISHVRGKHLREGIEFPRVLEFQRNPLQPNEILFHFLGIDQEPVI